MKFSIEVGIVACSIILAAEAQSTKDSVHDVNQIEHYKFLAIKNCNIKDKNVGADVWDYWEPLITFLMNDPECPIADRDLHHRGKHDPKIYVMVRELIF